MSPILRPLVAILVVSCAGHLAAQTGRRSEWTPVGVSGGGSMFGPAISPVDSKRRMVHCDMGAAYLSADGGRTWRMIHRSELRGNTTCKPVFHPTEAKTIFSPDGWAARLSVSRDGGETWTAIGNLTGRLRGAIGIDPARPDLMLAGVDEEVWRSTDAGRSWSRCAGPGGAVVGFAFGSTGRRAPRSAFAATEGGVWRSDDGGSTWADVSAGLPWKGVRGFAGGFDAKGRGGMLYAAIPSRRGPGGEFTGGVFRSADGGATWESAMGSGINVDTEAADQWAHGDVAQYHHVLTTDAEPLRVYAFNANTGVRPPHHTAVYRSDDGGRTWRPTFQPDPRFPGHNVEPDYTTSGDGQFYQAVPYGVAICASDPDVVLQVDAGNCIQTADGGRTWSNGHARPAGKAGWFDCTGLVVTSTWNYYVDPFEPARHYIAYTDIGFARSEDGGKTWRTWGKDEKAPWKNTTYELAFDPEVPGRIWGAFSNVHDIPNDNVISGRHGSRGPGGVCLSTDFGEHWKALEGGLPAAPCTSIVVDPRSPRGRRRLYAGFFGEGLYVSADDGATWSARNAGLGSAANRRVVRVVLHADGTLFALVTALREGDRWDDDGPGLYRSTDQGATWTRILSTLRWPKDVTVDAKDSRTIWVGAADAAGKQEGGLHRTGDGGASWTRVAREGPQHFGAYPSPHHDGWIYMTLCEGAPAAGLWLSKDGGRTWGAIEALPFSNAQRVAFDPKDMDRIYVTTFGGSVWVGPASPR